MKSKVISVRVDGKEKSEIEKFVKEKTDFDNVSDYIRSSIRRDMKKSKESSK